MDEANYYYWLITLGMNDWMKTRWWMDGRRMIIMTYLRPWSWCSASETETARRSFSNSLLYCVFLCSVSHSWSWLTLPISWSSNIFLKCICIYIIQFNILLYIHKPKLISMKKITITLLLPICFRWMHSSSLYV